jgi:uncharacterized membrane protein
MERFLHRFFQVSLWFKGALGVLELVAGALLLAVPHTWWSRTASSLTRAELIEDPRDPLSLWIRAQADALSIAPHVFAAVYLLVHAAIKLILVWAVLRDRLWAYPWMIGVLGAFIVYQTWDVLTKGSLLMAALTVLDVILIWMTWREWRMHSTRMTAAGGRHSDDADPVRGQRRRRRSQRFTEASSEISRRRPS